MARNKYPEITEQRILDASLKLFLEKDISSLNKPSLHRDAFVNIHVKQKRFPSHVSTVLQRIIRLQFCFFKSATLFCVLRTARKYTGFKLSKRSSSVENPLCIL